MTDRRLPAARPARFTRCQIKAPRLRLSAATEHPLLGLGGVDNAKPDRKGHKPRRPKWRGLMLVDLSRHSEISSHGFSPQLRIFLPYSGEITSRPRATRNLMRHRLLLEVRGSTVKRMKFSTHVAGHRCHERRTIGPLIGVSQSQNHHGCAIRNDWWRDCSRVARGTSHCTASHDNNSEFGGKMIYTFPPPKRT